MAALFVRPEHSEGKSRGAALRTALPCLAALALAVAAAPAAALTAPPPHVYGRVVLDQFTSRAGVPSVAFDHWRHRALFTCRLCHVDVGFAMVRGETRISAATNAGRFHCGACHDGQRMHDGRPIFAACAPDQKLDRTCARCHTGGADAEGLPAAFEAFAKGLPRRLGAVDWEQAEAQRLIRPVDFLEGVSVRRRTLRMDKEIAIPSRGSWMTGALFSHPKHAVWNGCEVCHPEIFPSAKAGTVRYTMLQIVGGQYCGACHDKVAFPLNDCARCHADRKP
jgi:c(7)-type cytochrome triheme protein